MPGHSRAERRSGMFNTPGCFQRQWEQQLLAHDPLRERPTRPPPHRTKARTETSKHSTKAPQTGTKLTATSRASCLTIGMAHAEKRDGKLTGFWYGEVDLRH
jgi:hypothetical protein